MSTVYFEPKNYQVLAMRTATDDVLMSQYRCLENAALGLCGESGEFADIIKKVHFQGHELNEEHLAKELGDILWYIALACEGMGWSLEYIMKLNIDKLSERYPVKFDSERSIHRAKGDI